MSVENRDVGLNQKANTSKKKKTWTAAVNRIILKGSNLAEYKYYQMSDEAEIVKKNISRRLDALWWYKKKGG